MISNYEFSMRSFPAISTSILTVRFIRSLSSLHLSTLLKPRSTHSCSSLFKEIIRTITREKSASLCSKALTICTRMSLSLQGKQLHSFITKSGYINVQPIQTQLLNFYVKCKEFEEGYKLFDEMPTRSIVSWNIMISGCRQMGVLFFKRMLFEMVEPDYITFVSLISSCVGLYDMESGKQLHCYIVKLDFNTDCVVCSGLIDLYGNFGFVEEARSLFDGVLDKDLVLWNVMVSCYNVNGFGEKALGIFRALRDRGLEGDEFTFSSLLCSCAIIGSSDAGKRIHGLIVKLSIDMDVLVSSALIDMYVKTENVVDARKVFDGMSNWNVVSWTVMIAGYGRQGDGKEAMCLLRNMLRGGYGPDELTLASILSSCASLAVIYEITQVHALASKKGLEGFLSIGNALINAYSKSGSMGDAYQAFRSIKDPNIIAWTSMISAHAFHGLPRQAIRVFEEMLIRGIKPDKISFVGVLSACSHGGLVDEGLHYFASMTSDHQIVPGLEHYACLIDLLGRAGHLGRAHNLMENMPTEPSADVLAAFVSACKAHGNISLAVLAAEKLFKLEPEDSVNYTLVSNTYASVGCWTDVARMRKLMKDRCNQKVPGYSWIEIGGMIHTFISRDISHPQATDMYYMLKSLGLSGDHSSIISKSDQSLI